MDRSRKEILEWLISEVDFSSCKELFGKKIVKQFDTHYDIHEIIALEEEIFLGSKLIERDGMDISFYPLTISNYLKENK